MALRWCAAGMVEAGTQFRRVNGYRHLPALRAALEAEVTKAVTGPCEDQEEVACRCRLPARPAAGRSPSNGWPTSTRRTSHRPKATQSTRFEVAIGRCGACRRRIQPRHPEQTSDALGAAGVQVGSRAVALAAWCDKGLGLPAGKVARLLGQLGLAVTPGGVTQAVARAARRCEPTYTALAEGVPASPVVAPDETGWRVGGRRAWLWAFAGQGVVVYRIAPGRGFTDAAAVLGEGFAGVLERDGWTPYRKFLHATHQTCLAHLLRRVAELLGDAKRRQAKTPYAVRRWSCPDLVDT